MPGAFPFVSRYNAHTSSSDGGAHEIVWVDWSSTGCSGVADDSASSRNMVLPAAEFLRFGGD